MRTRPPRHLVTATLTAALLSAPTLALTAVTASSQAATGDQQVSGTASPIWQTDGDVDTLATSKGVIYTGGAFTNVRPPGAAAGTQLTPRTYLAAFDSSTGALLTGFNVTLNGAVDDMAVSPSGNLLYIVGAFTTVNGTARSRIAALNLPSGTLDTAFSANANKTVTAVAVSSSAVYVGGDFTTVKSTAKGLLASLNPTTGAVDTGFSADLNVRPGVIDVAPDGSRVLVGGSFTTVGGAASQPDGTPNAGIVSLAPTTGAIQPWAASRTQPVNTGCLGRVTDIVSQGDTAYVTAEGDPPGCYEGTYSARISDGALNWNQPCLGASQGIALLGNVLYKASHQHDCAFSQGGASGGFVGGTSRDAFIHHYLVGQNVADGSFVHWTPNTNAAGTTSIGPHTIATDGSQLIVGGDFTQVAGVAQQGLTRFVSGGNAATPKTPGLSIKSDPWPGSVTRVVSSLPITVQPSASRTLTVEVPTVEDADSGTLTYRIYRDNGTTPVSTQTAESYPWSRPVLRYDDTGLVAGSSHSYRVTASDGTFTSAKSAAVTGTVAAAAPPALPAQYASLAPQLWWRLGDSGTAVSDSSSTGTATGTLQGGATPGAPGAVTGNTAVALDGATGFVASDSQVTEPGAFSESAWFKTTTTRGGTILAQSDSATGAGGNTDRTITMDNNGGLVFAVKAAVAGGSQGAAIKVRNQSPIWNDGRWHQVTGTYDGNGTASLYVDGWLQASYTGTSSDATVKAVGMPTSYQLAGYADLSTIQVVFGRNYYNLHWPLSEHLAGSIDEVASYDRALSPAEVHAQFAAGVGGGA